MTVPTDWARIAVTRHAGVTELRLHTDGGQLVWDARAHREITEALHWLATDRSTKAVILAGTGAAFCEAIDVGSFATLAWDEIWWEGRRMLNGLNDLDVPIVSVVNGPATVHAELAVLADIVLAAPTAEFADRAHFATRGTVPGDGVGVVWSSLLGPSRSRYFLMTGAAIGAAEARSLGFVHEIHDAGALHDRAWELASGLAEHPLAVLRYMKAALSLDLRRHFAEALSHGLALQGCGHWSKGGIRDE
jgi:enoyl-CoA hydratase/carnithine racemase